MVDTDHLLKYGGEENIIPHDSQVFYSSMRIKES